MASIYSIIFRESEVYIVDEEGVDYVFSNEFACDLKKKCDDMLAKKIDFDVRKCLTSVPNE